MRAWRAAFAALLLAASAAAAAEPDPRVEAADTDPRVEAADALLGDPGGFERAAALYAEVLAAEPDAADVRIKRARVLAWDKRFDESLEEYARLLQSPEPPPEARIERAEVLSWAGRLPEAESAFRALVAEDPDDARAARGLARCLAWSGQAGAADRAYARALALEDDPEARSERARLRAGHPPSLEQEFSYYEDSDGFRRLGGSSVGGVFFDLDTRATLQVGAMRVDAEPTPQSAGLPDSDRAVDARVGVSRRFGERLEGSLVLGGRSWEHAPARFLGRAEAGYTLASGGVARASVEHGDFLERSDSLAALERGISDTTTSLSLWHPLGRGLEYWGRFQASFLSDANERLAFESSLSWQPWEEWGLRVLAAGSVLSYTASSDLYYDPDSDLTAVLALLQRFELPAGGELELRAGGGYGRSQQDGASSAGFAYDVSGALSWVLGPLRLRLYGGRAQSRRANSYVSHHAGASLGFDL